MQPLTRLAAEPCSPSFQVGAIFKICMSHYQKVGLVLIGIGGGVSSLVGSGGGAHSSAFFLGGGGAGFFFPIAEAAAAAAAEAEAPNRWPRAATPLLLLLVALWGVPGDERRGGAAGAAAAEDPPMPKPGTEMPDTPSRDKAPWFRRPPAAPPPPPPGCGAAAPAVLGRIAPTGEPVADRGGSRGGTAGPPPFAAPDANAPGGGRTPLPLRAGGRGRFPVDRPVVSSCQPAPPPPRADSGRTGTSGALNSSPPPRGGGGGAGLKRAGACGAVGWSCWCWLRPVSRFGGGPNEFGSRSSLIGRASWLSLLEVDLSPRPMNPF